MCREGNVINLSYLLLSPVWMKTAIYSLSPKVRTLYSTLNKFNIDVLILSLPSLPTFDNRSQRPDALDLEVIMV